MQHAAIACAFLALTLGSANFSGNARAEEPNVSFARDIRPILSDNCFKCHGPDARERQAGLRLDQREGALALLESGGRAIVPGKSAESGVIQRVGRASEDERMPPPATGRKLTPAQIELLKRWIDQGAEYQGHWSFVRIQRPPLPPVRNESFVRNPIDRFVVARLEAEGLQPSPPADKVTLIRRVTLDLTGLPPTPAEIDDFLADTSPQAYEAVVDRLLKSPRYGEHMARYWLDVARYGDTHGLHLDNERSMWKYRDWVIDAFNANLPFDQFTIQQLAGDLLPNATLDQRIATGFCRCNVSTSEGGSIDEEVRVRYVVDRTETMATTFLGLTLGCAVCHDHKYDPVTQKEFYALSAFFNSAADPAMDGNTDKTPPIVKIPTPEDDAKLKALEEQMAQVRRQIAEALAKVEYQEPPAADAAVSTEPREFVWIDDATPPRANLQGNTPWEFVGKPDHPVHSGEKSSRRTAPGLSQHFFDGANPGLKIGEGDRLFAYVFLDPQNPPKTIMLQWNDGSWEHRAFWGEDLIPFGAGNGANHLPMGPLPPVGEWVRLEVECAKVGLGPGAVVNGWAYTQHDGTVYWDKSGLVTRTPQDGKGFVSLLVWEAYEKGLAKSSVPQHVRNAIMLPADQRSDEQKKQIRDYFLEYVFPDTRGTFDPLHQKLEALIKQKTDTENAIPTTMVMADVPQPRETFVLIRGAYDKRGEKVEPGVPAIFPPLPKDAPPNRLGLAQWLVDPAHPLTARVTVNRFWQQVFGRGIVKTSEDFGSQGQWPTHPELLDWLSAEFIETGWDVKRLMKLIVTSATYQQASRVTSQMAERDPENALLARGPRFRLDAEAVRDSALFVSGLLVERLGGRSVKPYQPPGIWEAIAFVGSNTREFKRDSGTALYRRSLYTYWKRTAPPPSLMAFDAPSRETCTARRPRTNTPLQALALMNDEQYVEASRFLARRMMVEGGAAPAERLAHGFRLVTARKPQSEELEVLLGVYASTLARYQEKREEAAKLLAVGEAKITEPLDPAEHAAYTMAANLLLNLDEAITKE